MLAISRGKGGVAPKLHKDGAAVRLGQAASRYFGAKGARGTALKVMILTCSPNREGLTESCGQAARLGVEGAGGTAVMARLNDLAISRCRACDSGWGPCRNGHRCQVADDFQGLHESIGQADGYIFVTPVYFGEPSESAKAFLDRLRRCESFVEGQSRLEGKPFICVAAAGGSGDGTVSCLATLERVFGRVKAERFDLMGVTRKSRDYMLAAIREAAGKMATS